MASIAIPIDSRQASGQLRARRPSRRPAHAGAAPPAAGAGLAGAGSSRRRRSAARSPAKYSRSSSGQHGDAPAPAAWPWCRCPRAGAPPWPPPCRPWRSEPTRWCRWWPPPRRPPRACSDGGAEHDRVHRPAPPGRRIRAAAARPSPPCRTPSAPRRPAGPRSSPAHAARPQQAVRPRGRAQRHEQPAATRRSVHGAPPPRRRGTPAPSQAMPVPAAPPGRTGARGRVLGRTAGRAYGAAVSLGGAHSGRQPPGEPPPHGHRHRRYGAPAELTFRDATEDDVPALVALDRVRLPRRRQPGRLDHRGGHPRGAADRPRGRARRHQVARQPAAGRRARTARWSPAASSNTGARHAYFGMFAVSPALQGAGLGKVVIAEAERAARETWGAREMHMTVISVRERPDRLVRAARLPPYGRDDAPSRTATSGSAFRSATICAFELLVKELADLEPVAPRAPGTSGGEAARAP